MVCISSTLLLFSVVVVIVQEHNRTRLIHCSVSWPMSHQLTTITQHFIAKHSPAEGVLQLVKVILLKVDITNWSTISDVYHAFRKGVPIYLGHTFFEGKYGHDFSFEPKCRVSQLDVYSKDWFKMMTILAIYILCDSLGLHAVHQKVIKYFYDSSLWDRPPSEENDIASL